jgi:hypothetical protein
MNPTLLAITLYSVSNGIIYAEDTYLPPKAIKVMFHVDKLPIDKGMRKQLSMNLTILAKRAHGGDAMEHRLTAQLLMLAMRLDRENTSAAELNKSLSKGGILPVSDVQAKVKSLQKLRDTIDLFSKADQLSEERLLNDYLKDVLVKLDKNSPLAAVHKEDKNRWTGIVIAFDNSSPERAIPNPISSPKPAPTAELTENLVNERKPIPPEPDQNNKKQEFTKWTKHNSGITTPLTLFTMLDDRARYRHEIVTMNTQISPRVKMESNLSLELKPWADAEKIDDFKNRIDPLMKAQFGKYESLKVEITTSGRLSSRSQRQILWPLFLQLKASERNIQVREGILVLGRLSGQNITRGSDFWHVLKLLRKSDAKNRRLLVPVSAERHLKQLVALEEEDFFVRNEVLLVSNLEESVDLLGQSVKSSVNEASVEFTKIQQMIGDKSVGPFAVNKEIRMRLEGILAKNPNHLSAKMILLRGNVSRPRKLDSYFIADELSVLLKKTSFMNKRAVEDIGGGHLGRLAEEIGKAVKELDPFLDSDDREMTSQLIEITGYLETLARAKAKQQEDFYQEKRESSAVKRTITQALDDFKVKYLEVKTHLDKVMSE